MNTLFRILVILLSWTIIACTASAGIAATKHNLSVTGPGPIRATAAEDMCIFCHIPHDDNPSPSAWNRDTDVNYYLPYTSSTVASSPGQPNGTSILCLSCHDGTIALGKLSSEPVPVAMLGGIITMPAGPSVLGTDISDDHPISFFYGSRVASQREDLVHPSRLTDEVQLDKQGRLQCTSCHDPHNDNNGKFLTRSNRSGALCKTCHGNFRYWQLSSHATSQSEPQGSATADLSGTQWQTVAENACGNCHQTHGAGGPEWLLKYQQEEDNCLVCHDGSVAKSNIADEFDKFSRHSIGIYRGEHSPDEPTVITSRHVECTDCHNPHAAMSNRVSPQGVLAGVKGVTIDGLEIKSVNHDYELCFRCHGDGFDKGSPRTTRQIEQQNVRAEFSLSNPSYHPVAGVGKNQNVPSLLPPYNTNSVMRCGDCHDSDDSSAVGGNGPRGPHGSTYPPILSMRYEALDNATESPSTYALCYKCHDRNSILGDQSFKSHRLHIVDQKTSCNTCHDPHGVSYTQGTSLNNSSLINFDTSVVKENSLGNLRYESTGGFTGSCYLMCHGSDHAPKNY